jgi:hypothetical protein
VAGADSVEGAPRLVPVRPRGFAFAPDHRQPLLGGDPLRSGQDGGKEAVQGGEIEAAGPRAVGREERAEFGEIGVVGAVGSGDQRDDPFSAWSWMETVPLVEALVVGQLDGRVQV